MRPAAALASKPAPDPPLRPPHTRPAAALPSKPPPDPNRSHPPALALPSRRLLRILPSSVALRAALAVATLTAALAAKLAFPSIGLGGGGHARALCDPAVGCTPAQLAAKRAPRPLGSYTHHSLQAAWGAAPADVELVDIVDAVLPRAAPGTRPGAVVNLGARDGRTHDPTYPLFARGHPGAAFEGWEPIFPALDANLGPFAGGGVAVIHEYARPDTFVAKLAGAGVTPANLDVLKIGE